MRTNQIDVLSLLNIKSSPQSIDYVKNKKQFQLHPLLTEQRHPKTWNLSFTIRDEVEEGLKQIFSVDEDISKRFHQIAKDTSLLKQAAHAVAKAIGEKRRISESEHMDYLEFIARVTSQIPEKGGVYIISSSFPEFLCDSTLSSNFFLISHKFSL